MGNASSFVSVTLTDNVDNLYVAGDTINGVVYVDVKENRRVQSLLVTLCGVEKHSAFNKKTNVSTTERNILDSSIPLIQFSQTLVKGQYEYPFQVILPETLPSSITRNKFGDYFAEITYKLDVRFKGERTFTTMLKNHTLKDEKSLTIIKKPHPIHLGPNGLQEPLLLPPTTKNFASFGCLKRGFFSLTGYLLNPVVDKDEKIKLRLVSHYWNKSNNQTYDASHLIRVAAVKIVQEISTYADSDSLIDKYISTICKGKFTCRSKTYNPTSDQFSHFANAESANRIFRSDCIRTLHDATRDNGTHMITGGHKDSLNHGIDPSGALQVDDIELSIPENRRTLQKSDTFGKPKNLIYSYMGHIIKVRHFIKIYFKTGWSVPDILTECSIFFEPLHRLPSSNRSTDYAAAVVSRVHETIPEWHAVPASMVSLDFSQVETGVGSVNPYNNNRRSSLNGVTEESDTDSEMAADGTISQPARSGFLRKRVQEDGEKSGSYQMTAPPIEATMVTGSSNTTGSEPIYVNATAIDGVNSIAVATSDSGNGIIPGATIVHTPQEILADFTIGLQNCVDDVATTVRFCTDPSRSASCRMLGPLELGRIVSAIHEPRDVHTVVSYLFNRMKELGNQPTMQHLLSAVLYADAAALMPLIRVGATILGDQVFKSQINELLIALNEDIASLVRAEFQVNSNLNNAVNASNVNVILNNTTASSTTATNNSNSNGNNERVAVAS